MESIRRFLIAFVALAVFCFLVSLLFVTALYAFAIFAPLLGLSYLGARLAAASQLWQSHGRFAIPGGVRIIGTSRARLIAVLFGIEGSAGLALSFVPALWVFNARIALIPVVLTALVAQISARIGRRQVLRSGHPVDVLPPE